ncbi:MAG: type III-B CRISPR module RAMP protein Cmr6 [Planctomycetes bacterium]|nr:type III-B CRISPR module RAMP protein Cmr6 [Planctomycetota bacterium]
MRPIYQSAAEEPRQRQPGGHAGLWFDKFCNQWLVQAGERRSWSLRASSNEKAGSNPKQDWIATVTDKPVGVREEIREAVLRRLQLVQACGGRVAVLRTQSRFASGLGRSHPIENGFAWHPTLGTPYLPGSSVKGAVLAWARETGVDPELHEHVFGAAERVGSLCFLGAIPLAPVSLEADVMTPHYAGWSESDPPGDWRSPTPIPFLTTAVDTRFLFSFVPRARVPAAELDRVMQLLVDALETVGAGAKTAVGYGRMVRDDACLDELRSEFKKEESRRRDQQRRAAMDPLDRELEDLAAANTSQARFITWLQAAKDGQWSGEALRSVLERIRREMEREGCWLPLPQENKTKRKHHERTLLVLRLMQEGSST